MKSAFESISVHFRIREGVSFVRAEILHGVEVSAAIYDGDLRTVFKLDGRAPPGRNVLGPADRDDATATLRFPIVFPALSHFAIY